MKRGRYAILSGLIALLAAPAVRAEVFPVPQAIRDMRGVHEDVHVLRSLADGTPLGEQRFRAVVDHDVLALTVVTRFDSGEQWDESADMDLSKGYRAKDFHKIGRAAGKVIAETNIDFASGQVSWLRDGQRGERTFAFAPDTYMGPMLGVVLAGVPETQLGVGTLQTIVFRPDPQLYTLRADVIDQENFKVGNVTEPTTKVRVKADLGPVQNVVFASLIPTHYFWFTRESPPEFFAFEGSLGYGGPELRMIPQRVATSTAKAD